MPFFAWQCLTIKLKHRDIDLVFKDEQDHNNFVKFLIYNMNTIDGTVDSAIPLLSMLEMQSMADYRKKKNLKSTEMPDYMMRNIRHFNKVKVARKTYLKFLIIKLRFKISFIAFKNKMTIVELFCNSIIKTYNQLVNEGSIVVNEVQLEKQANILSSLKVGNSVKNVLKMIMVMNINNIKGTELERNIQSSMSARTLNIFENKSLMDSNSISKSMNL